jgi:acyl-CoA synthetase (NDP forming)
MKDHFLNSFFYPGSIAVVGASNNEDALSFGLFYNLINLGFKGKLYPVNPNTPEILGVRTYKTLREIEGNVDMVISAVSAERTVDILDQYIEKKVKALVIVSGGFSETGDHGLEVQNSIAQKLQASGIRTIGPNTLSPICFDSNLVISFRKIKTMRKGCVSMIFQSGMYDPRLNWLVNDFHLGINKILDLGNKMDINEVEAIEYLADDESTGVICIHTEAIKSDGHKFFEALRTAARKKPVILLKGGSSADGARAAASHTGSIIKESDFLLNGILKQAGVIRAQYIEEMLDFAKAFEYVGAPGPEAGKRCAVASFSGGEGVLTTDICNQAGFSMSVPDARTVEGLKQLFPSWQINANPIDMGICFQFYQHDSFFETYLSNMAGDPNTDCLLVQFPDIEKLFMREDLYKSFEAVKRTGKPIVSWAATRDPGMIKPIEVMELHHIPIYYSASSALKSLAALYQYTAMKNR